MYIYINIKKLVNPWEFSLLSRLKSYSIQLKVINKQLTKIYEDVIPDQLTIKYVYVFEETSSYKPIVYFFDLMECIFLIVFYDLIWWS